jgi:hypothetical protein
MYQAPYVARLGESFTRPWTTDDGKTYESRLNMVDVFSVENGIETKIGEYEVSAFKGAKVVFHPFKRNGKWYALTTNSNKLFVYSLPDMQLVAEEETHRGGLKMHEFYIPRFWHSTYDHHNKDGSFWFRSHNTLINDQIEEEYDDDSRVGYVFEPDWNHADFGFVSAYDPYSSGPTYASVIDLSRIEEGVVCYKRDDWFEVPSWLELSKIVNLNDWSKSYPTFEIATSKPISTVTVTECGNGGWTKEQMGNLVPEGEE